MARKLKNITDTFEKEKNNLISVGRPSWMLIVDVGHREAFLEGRMSWDGPKTAQVYVFGNRVRNDTTGIKSEVYPVQFYKYKK